MRMLCLWMVSLCVCMTTHAQFSVALVGGPQSNLVSPALSFLPGAASSTNGRYTGINAGLAGFVALNRKESVFFRTGVLYSAKGSQLVQHFDTAGVDLSSGPQLLQSTTKLNLNYIDLPAGLLFKFPVSRSTKFLLGAGLQASLFYSGSTDVSTISVYRESPDPDVKLEYKQLINNDLPVGNVVNKYSILHFSASALAGFEFGRVFITAGYSQDLTGFYQDGEQSFKHKTLGAHLGIYLGNPLPKTRQVKDRDGDGIPDEVDRCPDLPGTALTGGCPDADGDGIPDKDDKCPKMAGTLQNMGCPLTDRDGDGVPDKEDKCPDVPGLKKYDGCPVPDSDHDGVNDEEDKCPDLAGSIDNQGCPHVTDEQKQKLAYAARQLQFEFKKAELSTASFPVLDEVAGMLRKNPTLRLRVEGHTSGPDSGSNRVLSQKRADSVRDYLTGKGIDPERIIAQGFGSSRHISRDGDKKENPVDRRVELIVF